MKIKIKIIKNLKQARPTGLTQHQNKYRHNKVKPIYLETTKQIHIRKQNNKTQKEQTITIPNTKHKP